MTAGVVGYGVYIPRSRIKREEIAKVWGGRGKGENAVLNENEDVITMAVEASLNAMEHAGLDDPREIQAVYFATDSSPNVEYSSIGVISQTLGVRQDIDAIDFTSSTRSSIAALKASMDAVNAGRIDYGLVIASDYRPASPGSNMEMCFGGGAVAFVIGNKNTIADLEETYSYSSNFRDSWRSQKDAYVKDYEPRFTRQYGYTEHIIKSTKGLLSKVNLTIDQFQHVVFQQPDARLPMGIAKKLGVTSEQTKQGFLFQDIGDIGAACLFMGVSSIFDNATSEDKVLAVSYGSGTSDALYFTVKETIERKRKQSKSYNAYLASKSYIDYTQYLRSKGTLKKDETPPKMGVSPLSPFMWRAGSEIYRLIGAQCLNCGYINFPPSQRKICIRCSNTDFKEVVFARRGTIHTFCVNYYMPPGFESPLPIIIADLDDGVRHRALGTEMSPQEIEIDMPVELVLRRLTSENNVDLYGNVFRPIRIK
ncbi:MAG: hydroxymethylglutaryl-CoA synthase [Thermodesulfobacteriota bacterium]|nr:hydroxymethylglutaryl-CoA synthase [Thermodesulfobacteriota bacterium]